MSTKTFTLNSFIPRITSITKSEVPTVKRSAGRIPSRMLSARSVSNSAAAPSRSRTTANNWVSLLSAGGIALSVVGLGFYVVMINAYASKGYELKHQQTVMQELTETQKQLVIQQAASGSIVKVNDLAATSGMVPVTGEEFLKANQISKR